MPVHDFCTSCYEMGSVMSLPTRKSNFIFSMYLYVCVYSFPLGPQKNYFQFPFPTHTHKPTIAHLGRWVHYLPFWWEMPPEQTSENRLIIIISNAALK